MRNSSDSTDAPGLAARLVRLILLGYWLALFIATHTPLPPKPPSIANIDKLFHLAAYALLALLCAWTVALRTVPTKAQYAKILLILAAYGALDELLQIPVGRTCDLADWLCDIAGVVIGLLVFMACLPMLRRLGLVYRNEPVLKPGGDRLC